MTEQPIAPAPSAPAPAAPPVPASAPAAQPAPAAEPDWKALAEQRAAEVEEWKGHSRTWETRARGNQQAEQAAAERDAQLAKIAEALGLAPEKPDPEKIAAQLQQAQAEKASLARQNAVLLAANTAGADASALLDSRSFLASLENVDPGNPAAVLDAVKAAVAANPRYAAATPQQPATAPAPPPRQASTAGSFNASPGGARQLTAADVKSMSGAELSKAASQGLLAEYFATPNQ